MGAGGGFEERLKEASAYGFGWRSSRVGGGGCGGLGRRGGGSEVSG